MRASWRQAYLSGGLWRTRSAVLASLSLTLAASSGGAQMDAEPQWARLARQAEVIVVGECTEENANWDDGVIATTVQFRPYRFYKGDLARVLTVKTLGGRVGEDSMAASHGASLAAGEQVLLFLKRSEFGPYFVVVGGEAGRLVIDGLPPVDAGGAPTTGTRSELTRLLNRSTTAR